eukprot:9161445-Ditylum_brightwellii.AAC.1
MFAKFRTGLLTLKTNHMICQVLIYKFQQWCGTVATPPSILCNELGDILTDTVQDQNKLGWNDFVKERISKLWDAAQAVHT